MDFTQAALTHVIRICSDTPENFQILTDCKNVGDLRHENYFNHF